MTENLKLEGIGRFKFENGSIYEGEWKLINNKKAMHGNGKITFCSPSTNDKNKESYSGNWENDKMNGFGVYNYITGCIYKGEWKNSMHNGKGEYYFPDGSIYKGDWENHKMHGIGCFINSNGKILNGQFRNGSFNAQNQEKLKIEKIVSDKIELLKNNVKEIILEFFDIIKLNDKKSLKEIPNKYFFNSVQDELKLYYKGVSQKFEEYKIDQWTNLLTFITENLNMNIIKSPDDWKIIDKNLILKFNFGENSQIIEIDNETKNQERRVYLVIFLVNNKFIISNFHDNKQPEKKK